MDFSTPQDPNDKKFLQTAIDDIKGSLSTLTYEVLKDPNQWILERAQFACVRVVVLHSVTTIFTAFHCQDRAEEYACKYDHGERWSCIQVLRDAITLAHPRIVATEGNQVLPEPPLQVPEVPARSYVGCQYQGFSADLALELCRNSILSLPTNVQERLHQLVQQAERLSTIWFMKCMYNSPRKGQRYARQPWEDEMTGPE